MNGTVSDEAAARNAIDERRRLFKSALALARTTGKQWAADNDVSEQHLYAVLKGARESAKLLAKIDAFIDEQHSRAA